MYKYPVYHNSGNFRVQKFYEHENWYIFVLKYFCGLGQPWKYNTRKFMYIHWENGGLRRDLCVHDFHVNRNIYAVLGSVSPYVSAISGAVSIVCASFSPFPNLDVLLHCRLHFLIARVTAWASIADESEPFGSGKPSLRCRYCNRAIFTRAQLFAWT